MIGIAAAVLSSVVAAGPVASLPQDSVSIESKSIGRLVFDGASGDFACRGLFFGETRFIDPEGSPTNLWRLTFRSGVNGAEKALEPSAAKSRRWEKTRDGVRFIWNQLDLDAGDGAVDVVCDVSRNEGEGRFEFRIKVANRSGKYGLFDTEYPKLSTLVRPGKGSLVLPCRNWGASRILTPFDCKRIYPDYTVPMQLTLFDADDGHGVMVAALDPEARIKYLMTHKGFGVSFLVPAEGAGLPGACATPPFAFAVCPYRGNWWRGAKLYRAWAEKAKVKWLSKGKIADRKDFPKSMRDPGLWLILEDEVPVLERNVNRVLEKVAGRVPVSVHWYGWSAARKRGDPIYPTYFPAHPDFSNAVRRCVAKGVNVMPYMNARIWGHLDPRWPEARRYACCQPDGSTYVERWREKDFSAMCQYTKFWRDDVVSVADRLFDEFGATSLYLDQIASMTAVICYSSEHGHPVGGGSHWVDGYRQMADDIRRRHPDKPLTSENFCEPYVDSFDNFLLWCPNYDTDIPLTPAVYSGYMETFACSSSAWYTMEAFRAVNARSLIWGCQGGWCRAEMIADAQTEKFEYLVKLVQIRRENLEYFSDGELMGEVENREPVPVLDLKWNQWGQRIDAHVPAMQAMRWRSPAGREMVVVANYSDKELPFDGGEDGLRFKLAAGEIRIVKQ